jgi:GT2 family glycosyltransferase
MMPAVPTSVTICVIVLDRLAALTRCLDAIAQLTVPVGVTVDVVVVDNGSNDGTWQLLQQRPHLTTRRVHGSVGVARNATLALATGDVVAYTDSDCVPDTEWLVHGLAPFADPSVGVVQGRTRPAEDSGGPWSVTQDIDARTGLFEACNVLYRREVLKAAGGFGESIGFFGEDTVAGWRVLRAGWRDVFAPDAVVAHDVTRPGYRWHVRRARYYAHWPELIRDFPEVRRDLLWHHWFLRRRSAESLLTLAGLLLARRRPAALIATAPLLWRHRPTGLSREAARQSAGAVVFDLAVELALLQGTVKARTVLL